MLHVWNIYPHLVDFLMVNVGTVDILYMEHMGMFAKSSMMFVLSMVVWLMLVKPILSTLLSLGDRHRIGSTSKIIAMNKQLAAFCLK